MAATARKFGQQPPIDVSSINRGGGGGGGDGESLSKEQNQKLIIYVAYFFAAVMIMRILSSYLFTIICIPFAYLYMMQTCPSEESFDVRKELKRVLRGHHLPEDHPDKPKGFLSETLARVAASVTTEIATGLGYEMTVYKVHRIAIAIWVRVPSARMDFYWIGALSRWTYVYGAEIPDNKKDD